MALFLPVGKSGDEFLALDLTTSFMHRMKKDYILTSFMCKVV